MIKAPTIIRMMQKDRTYLPSHICDEGKIEDKRRRKGLILRLGLIKADVVTNSLRLKQKHTPIYRIHFRVSLPDQIEMCYYVRY